MRLLEWQAASQQLNQNEPESIDIGLRCSESALHHGRIKLFGRHVGRGAGHAVRVNAGKVEVKEHRPSVLGEQDVGRLDVPVQDSTIVCMCQPIGQLRTNPKHRLDEAHAIQGFE